MISSLKNRTAHLLRWSERYTHLDMVYFASGSFWQTFGQVASSIMALGLVLVFANFLPKETYGTYRYLISIAGLLNVFTLTGMSAAVSQAVANGKEGVLRTSVRYQLKWNSILMLAFLLLGGYYLWHENYALTGGLLVLGLCIPLINAFNTYGAYLAGKREFKLNNIFGVLTTAIYTVGMVAIIFISGEVIWLIVAYALSTLISTALFYFVTVWRFKPPLEPAQEATDTLKYGRRLTYINLMGPVVSQLDSILLASFWGATNLAVYSIAMAIPNRAIPLIKDWVDLGFPKVAVKTVGEINRTFYKRLLQGFAVGAVFAIGYAVTAPLIFTYLMPQYLEALFFTQLLAINFLFAMPNRYISTLLTSQKMAKRIFINNVVQNTVRILSYIVLGVWGGILGLVIAQVLNAAFGLLINILTWRLNNKSA